MDGLIDASALYHPDYTQPEVTRPGAVEILSFTRVGYEVLWAPLGTLILCQPTLECLTNLGLLKSL